MQKVRGKNDAPSWVHCFATSLCNQDSHRPFFFSFPGGQKRQENRGHPFRSFSARSAQKYDRKTECTVTETVKDNAHGMHFTVDRTLDQEDQVYLDKFLSLFEFSAGDLVHGFWRQRTKEFRKVFVLLRVSHPQESFPPCSPDATCLACASQQENT